MDIPINLRNPAQFFSAAGLAQLFGAPSRFEVEEYEGEPSLRGTFILPDCDLQALLIDLKAATYTEVSESDGTVYSHDDDFSRPVHMILGEQTIELDWWLNEFWSKKSELKTWAGTSSPKSMLSRLSDMILPDEMDVSDLFNQGVLATGSSRPTWGFDPRVTRNTGVAGRLAKVKIYPIVELLCAIGLQYCRPMIGDEDITFYVWRDELPVELTGVAGELECVRTLALTARREKRSKGIFNYSAAEFVANPSAFRANRRVAKLG